MRPLATMDAVWMEIVLGWLPTASVMLRAGTMQIAVRISMRRAAVSVYCMEGYQARGAWGDIRPGEHQTRGDIRLGGHGGHQARGIRPGGGDIRNGGTSGQGGIRPGGHQDICQGGIRPGGMALPASVYMEPERGIENTSAPF